MKCRIMAYAVPHPTAETRLHNSHVSTSGAILAMPSPADQKFTDIIKAKKHRLTDALKLLFITNIAIINDIIRATRL